MPERRVGQPETKARRGAMLQQGSDRGQSQGMGTPSSMAGMGTLQDPLPAMGQGLCLTWSWLCCPGQAQGTPGSGKSKGTLMWQQDRVTRQGDHREPGLLHNRSPQMWHSQPQSRAAGAAWAGDRVSPHTAGMSPQPEEPKPPPVEKQTRMKAWESKATGSRSPWRTHMWPAERPRALAALPTLKHTTGTH